MTPDHTLLVYCESQPGHGLAPVTQRAVATLPKPQCTSAIMTAPAISLHPSRSRHSGVSALGPCSFWAPLPMEPSRGTSQSRARGRCFDNMYKRLSAIHCRYHSRMITAAAGLQTATTGRGWIRGACRPCPDLHLYGPSPIRRDGGWFVSLPSLVPSLAWVVLARWSALLCALVP